VPESGNHRHVVPAPIETLRPLIDAPLVAGPGKRIARQHPRGRRLLLLQAPRGQQPVYRHTLSDIPASTPVIAGCLPRRPRRSPPVQLALSVRATNPSPHTVVRTAMAFELRSPFHAPCREQLRLTLRRHTRPVNLPVPPKNLHSTSKNSFRNTIAYKISRLMCIFVRHRSPQASVGESRAQPDNHAVKQIKPLHPAPPG
jgi:hypothetical protein